MERTQELFEKIEGYLANTLSKEEGIAFRKELAVNKELQVEVEKHRELHDALSDTDTLAFAEKIRKIRKEMIQEEADTTATSGFRFSSFLKIAASLVLIISLGTLLWQVSRHDSPQDLYTAYYVPYPVEDVTRGVDQKESDEFQKKYREKKYEEVSVVLEKISEDTMDERHRLYLGNSYLNIGREQDALLQFQQISDTSKYYEHASWFRALTYLKLEDTEASALILQKIITYNGIYAFNAKELLEKLEKK
ncbi:hypothetical protein GCM10022393_16140 [Aquimarina addita]|uniref:Tetratricopeptide repeat protein n=1 Tax=Aquimarina addita TaxID=870485 RepID=A0ABP7XGE0_9FLAO